MNKISKIYVAGHKGLVGSAIVRELEAQGYVNIIKKTHSELELLNQQKVEDFFAQEKPEYVFLAAAKVGGIMANKTQKADFLYENLQLQNNVIYSAYKYGVKKLIFLGSSCIYPAQAPQPIREEYLLTGPLEPTNDAYAIAKIAGIKMCQSFNEQYSTNFISVMPTNLYGINDNYNLQTSHVLPALIHKFHLGKVAGHTPVVLWGDGSARREFMYSGDMAAACIYLMQNYNGNEFVNLGTGEEYTIKELAVMVQKAVGHRGQIIWDTAKPNGMHRKRLDIAKLQNTGFKPKTSLEHGIKIAYQDLLNNYERLT